MHWRALSLDLTLQVDRGSVVSTIEKTAALVDMYIRTRAARLKSQQETTKLEEEEKNLKRLLIEIAIASKVISLGGSVGVVNYRRNFKPKVEDWDLVYGYISKHGAFELLQKRLGEKAVEERWEDSIAIPGIVKFPVDDLTISGVVK